MDCDREEFEVGRREKERGDERRWDVREAVEGERGEREWVAECRCERREDL